MKSNSSLLSILALSGLSLAATASQVPADVAVPAAPTSVKPAISAKPASSAKSGAATNAPETDTALFSDKDTTATPSRKVPKTIAVKLTPPTKVPGATTLVATDAAKPVVKLDVALRATEPVAQPANPVVTAKPGKTAAKNVAVNPHTTATKKTAHPVTVSLPKSDASKNAAKTDTPAVAEVKQVAVDNAGADRTHPEELASRHKDAEMLAQLDADLDRSQQNLDKAGADLSEGQKQLASFTGVLNQAMLEAGPDAKGLNPFVKVAQRYAGTPYVWGGESRTGFDCSGFIMVVMRDLGYKALPHSAAEQFHYGLPIAQPLLKPGDLVFFANTYKPGVSHVGIYLGRRRFIHAAGTGIGTIVSSLDNPHFQAKYAGARRLVQSER